MRCLLMQDISYDPGSSSTLSNEPSCVSIYLSILSTSSVLLPSCGSNSRLAGQLVSRFSKDLITI